MSNVSFVYVRNSFKKLSHILSRINFRQASILFLRESLNQLLAFDILHDQIDIPSFFLVLISFIVLDNILMIQFTQYINFLVYFIKNIYVFSFIHYLNCNPVFFVEFVIGKIHLSKPSFAKLFCGTV